MNTVYLIRLVKAGHAQASGQPPFFDIVKPSLSARTDTNDLERLRTLHQT
jgi:hypothetical protein